MKRIIEMSAESFAEMELDMNEMLYFKNGCWFLKANNDLVAWWDADGKYWLVVNPDRGLHAIRMAEAASTWSKKEATEMAEFERGNLHFDWEGMESGFVGICADSVYGLKMAWENGVQPKVVRKSTNVDFPFDNGVDNYKFAYVDPAWQVAIDDFDCGNIIYRKDQLPNGYAFGWVADSIGMLEKIMRTEGPERIVLADDSVERVDLRNPFALATKPNVPYRFAYLARGKEFKESNVHIVWEEWMEGKEAIVARDYPTLQRLVVRDMANKAAISKGDYNNGWFKTTKDDMCYWFAYIEK